MRILFTGHRGHVGVPVAAQLRSRGHDVVGYDRVDGDDLLDLQSVKRAAQGCAAIVHAGAIPNDDAGSAEEIMAVNVLGTWHVLLAAEAAGVGKVVCFSSAAVLGIFDADAVLPDYFPVDDAHPSRAIRPYGLSKCLAEDLCAGLTARTGIPTVALRPARGLGSRHVPADRGAMAGQSQLGMDTDVEVPRVRRCPRCRRCRAAVAGRAPRGASPCSVVRCRPYLSAIEPDSGASPCGRCSTVPSQHASWAGGRAAHGPRAVLISLGNHPSPLIGGNNG